MTTVKKSLALRQLDSMFSNLSLEKEGRRSPIVSSTIEHDPRCDVHGRCSTPYRSSLYLHSRESTPGYCRDAASPTNGLIIRRKDSNRFSASPGRELEHPSTFPSILRRDRQSPSVTPPRRETPSPTQKNSSKRHSMGSFPNLSRTNIVNYNRRDSTVSNGIRELKRDYVGSITSLPRKSSKEFVDSMSCLSRKSSKDSMGSMSYLPRKSSKDYIGSMNSLSRKSSIDTKKSSTDSLDVWHTLNNWDTDKNTSISSLLHDDILSYGHNKVSTGDDDRQEVPTPVTINFDAAVVHGFKPVTVLEDLQPVRCAEFHPNGKLYAVGSNTKTLRICTYPNTEAKDFKTPTAPTVFLKRTKHHRGSIYCMAWSPAGDLLATGSNDKTVKIMSFDSHSCNFQGQEVELSMHNGTVRDVCFIQDTSNRSSLLVSGGAGDCKIFVTDCATGNAFLSLSGHSGHVHALYNWGGAMFVSGSQDKTVRLWDLRTSGCVSVIDPIIGVPNEGSAVTSLAVDPSGRLLVCGHEDSSCDMRDIRYMRDTRDNRGPRVLQRFVYHTADVRSVRFSPGAYYLLTAAYDGRIILTDLQGDLTCQLPCIIVARHTDKVISARWHPEDFSFLSTSADKTVVLWSIPPS